MRDCRTSCEMNETLPLYTTAPLAAVSETHNTIDHSRQTTLPHATCSESRSACGGSAVSDVPRHALLFVLIALFCVCLH